MLSLSAQAYFNSEGNSDDYTLIVRGLAFETEKVFDRLDSLNVDTEQGSQVKIVDFFENQVHY